MVRDMIPQKEDYTMITTIVGFILFMMIVAVLACVAVLTWDVAREWFEENKYKRAQRRKEEGRK